MTSLATRPIAHGRRTTRLETVAFVLACVFAAEIILGGPGYWMVGGTSIRKLLFMLNLLVFGALWLGGTIRLGRGGMTLAGALLLFMSVWILLIPAWRDTRQVSMAFQDGSPLATALLGLFFFAFFERRPAMWQTFCRVATVCLSLVAVFNIALWCLGMTGEDGNFLAQAIALFYFTLGNIDLDPPLYVGMMADGFFRALWITGTLYLPALLYCIAVRHFAGVLLFSLALLATYTRSLWLAAALGLIVAQAVSTRRERFVDGRVIAGALIAGCLLVVTVGLLSSGADEGLFALFGNRVASTFSDSSAEQRYAQVGPLLDAWQDSPVIGKGFGASASLVRSEETPFSYELTVLAMLMKTGVFGLLTLGIIVMALWLPALLQRSSRSRTACAGMGAIMAFLAASATNPYLVNFVGMSALSFMFTKLHFDRLTTQP